MFDFFHSYSCFRVLKFTFWHYNHTNRDASWMLGQRLMGTIKQNLCTDVSPLQQVYKSLQKQCGWLTGVITLLNFCVHNFLISLKVGEEWNMPEGRRVSKATTQTHPVQQSLCGAIRGCGLFFLLFSCRGRKDKPSLSSDQGQESPTWKGSKTLSLHWERSFRKSISPLLLHREPGVWSRTSAGIQRNRNSTPWRTNLEEEVGEIKSRLVSNSCSDVFSYLFFCFPHTLEGGDLALICCSAQICCLT